MENFPQKNKTYEIFGLCMEVQRTLGFGFSEIIYKDAMQIEFECKKLLFIREPELSIQYKGKKLQHRFSADFICHNEIIIEAKTSEKGITYDHIAQVLNYLRVSGNTLGLIINFGKRRLEYKRLISSFSTNIS
ncbi:MAG: GxxExxY protein [Bacteroidota bacterium]|nr:GxxExxY protein [Bacteroidota bacterium]